MPHRTRSGPRPRGTRRCSVRRGTFTSTSPTACTTARTSCAGPKESREQYFSARSRRSVDSKRWRLVAARAPRQPGETRRAPTTMTCRGVQSDRGVSKTSVRVPPSYARHSASIAAQMDTTWSVAAKAWCCWKTELNLHASCRWERGLASRRIVRPVTSPGDGGSQAKSMCPDAGRTARLSPTKDRVRTPGPGERCKMGTRAASNASELDTGANRATLRSRSERG